MNRKNAFGFSLVEIMIGAAMLGGIGLGTATLMKNMSKGNLKAQSDSETLLAFNEMIGILSDPTNCLTTFTGKSAAGDSITQLSHKGSAKFVTNTAFGNNNLKILSYSVGGYNSTTKESTLTINFEKKQMLGGGSIPRTLKLFTEIDGAGKISGCRALATYSQELWKLSTETPGGIFYAGNIGVGTTAPMAMLDVTGGVNVTGGIKATGGVTIGAVGANTDTTCSVTAGTTRYNATSDKMEYCNKLGKWMAFGGGATAFTATGGTITTSGAYTVHIFTSSGTFTAAAAGTVEYLVVGGGGGGGSAPAGGGGAGGFRTGTLSIMAQSYPITVGAGGGGRGAYNSVGLSGGSSIFASISSSGGGGGGACCASTASGIGGGSGGGGTCYAGVGGIGNIGGFSPSEGNNGGTSTGSGSFCGGGGGGGAGGPGGATSNTAGGAGGAGLSSSISGTSKYYSGGGGGAAYGSSGTAGNGGVGGGGGGSYYSNYSGSEGIPGGEGATGGSAGNGGNGGPNTGGGGGGSSYGSPDGVGGNGGSGIVIIRYLTNGA